VIPSRLLVLLAIVLVGCAAPMVPRDVREDPSAPTPVEAQAVVPAYRELVGDHLEASEGKNVVLYGFARGDIDDAWYVFFYADPPGGHTIEVHRRAAKDRPPSGQCARIFGVLHVQPSPASTSTGTLHVAWLDAYDWGPWAQSGHPDHCLPFPT
jgi:hypothetical protein